MRKILKIMLIAFAVSSTQKVGVFGWGSVQINCTNTTAVTQDVDPIPGNSLVRLNAL
jgi:hypothetical protein